MIFSRVNSAVNWWFGSQCREFLSSPSMVLVYPYLASELQICLYNCLPETLSEVFLFCQHHGALTVTHPKKGSITASQDLLSFPERQSLQQAVKIFLVLFSRKVFHLFTSLHCRHLCQQNSILTYKIAVPYCECPLCLSPTQSIFLPKM